MKTIFLRSFFFLSVIFSIIIIYYVNVVQKDFFIYTNEDGPDTSDYFLIETESYDGDS